MSQATASWTVHRLAVWIDSSSSVVAFQQFTSCVWWHWWRMYSWI